MNGDGGDCKLYANSIHKRETIQKQWPILVMATHSMQIVMLPCMYNMNSTLFRTTTCIIIIVELVQKGRPLPQGVRII